MDRLRPSSERSGRESFASRSSCMAVFGAEVSPHCHEILGGIKRVMSHWFVPSYCYDWLSFPFSGHDVFGSKLEGLSTLVILTVHSLLVPIDTLVYYLNKQMRLWSWMLSLSIPQIYRNSSTSADPFGNTYPDRPSRHLFPS